MQISILFSTYNGADVIGKVLDGYAMQNTENIEWELIIVNNASTDKTQEVIDSFLEQLPITTFIHNTPGKNSALNAAISMIKGDFVIVTDDDAIPNEGFIQNWLYMSEKNNNYDLFGGGVTPFFTETPPDWMVKNKFHFEEVFACRNLNSGPIEAQEIFGPNMAVRKRVFDAGVTFNEDIGPNGSNKNYPMGSETEFCSRVSRLGYKSYFSHESCVNHIVRAHQIRPSFWKHRAYKHGLGRGMQEALQGHSCVFKVPLIMLKMSIKLGVNLLRWLLVKDELLKNESWWQLKWDLGYTVGKCKEILSKS